MKKKGALIGVLVVAVVIAVKVALKLGLVFGISEAEITASKMTDWPKEFKEGFVSGCVDNEKGNKVMETYCSCIATGIEGAHIIATKYNASTTSEDEYTAEVSSQIDAFLESPGGDKVAGECIQVAKAQAPPVAPSVPDPTADAKNAQRKLSSTGKK